MTQQRENSSVKDAGALAKEFSQRLKQAIANSPHIPSHFNGQQSWIANELNRLWGLKVSTETVRKWVHGETKPREPKALKLAELFQVDPIWLYHGVQQVKPSERRAARNALASGAVNIVAGMIQMDGGAIAFTPEEDGRSDLLAIIQGTSYSIRVVNGDWSPSTSEARFLVPATEQGVTVLGLLRSGSSVSIVTIDREMLAAGKVVRSSEHDGAHTEVLLDGTEIRRRLVPSFRQGV